MSKKEERNKFELSFTMPEINILVTWTHPITDNGCPNEGRKVKKNLKLHSKAEIPPKICKTCKTSYNIS